MNVRGSMTRLVTVAVCATIVSTGCPQPASAADPTAKDSNRRDSRASAVKRDGIVQGAAVTDLSPAGAVQLVNAHRTRYGVAPLALDSASTAALNAHARYVSLNIDTDPDTSTEESSRPGHTAAGAAIAPYAEPMWTPTWRATVAGAMGDPYLRAQNLLAEEATTIGFGMYADVRVFVMGYTGEPSRGYPRTYPAKQNVTDLRHQTPWLQEAYGCAGIGFPITVQHDDAKYGETLSSTGTLLGDGGSVPACNVAADRMDPGAAAIVPTNALRPGTHYTGKFVTTMQVLAGGTETVTRDFDFTTAAAATRIAGDQTGDRAGDLFVRRGGELWFYKGRPNGTLGHGWRVGRGWSAMNWISLAGDVDKDGRSDLLARRGDGTLWLYQSKGTGQLGTGRRLGQGWGGLSHLTVVGDMNADGVTDLVARTRDGRLLRYGLSTSIGKPVVVAGRWNGIKHMVGLGSLDGDKRADIVALNSQGKLYVYPSTSKGAPGAGRLLNAGFGGRPAVFSPGDLNGDGRSDLMVRTSDGSLHAHLNTGRNVGPAIRAARGFRTETVFS